MTNQETDDLIRKLLTGDDGTVKFDPSRIEAALSGNVSAYNCGKGLSVAFRKPDTCYFNQSDVIPFEDPRCPGVNSAKHLWDMRDQYSHGNRSALERYTTEYREPAETLDAITLIEKCRLKGVLLDLQPTRERYVINRPLLQ